MKEMPDKCVDLVLTDPPYGLRIGRSGKIGGSNLTEPTQYEKFTWDNEGLTLDQWREIKRVSTNQIVFGFNILTHVLGNSRGVIVWDKKCRNNWWDNFSDCEIAWTSFDCPDRVFRHLWMGALRWSEVKRVHPTQKPLPLFEWIVQNYSAENEIIFDPFLGSGTTTEACKNLKRDFIGIEINPDYYKIAKERLAQGVL